MSSTASPRTVPAAPVAAPPSRHEQFVQNQLELAQRRIRSLDLTASLLGLAGLVMAYALVMTLADRWLELPSLIRQWSLAAFLLGIAGYVTAFVIYPLTRRLNPYYAAVQVERTLPDAKNALVNWLDLRERPLPPVMRGAVSGQAARQVAEADLDTAISTRRVAVAGALAFGLFLGLLGHFIAGPRPFLSLFGRTFAPFLERGIATRTEIRLVEPAGGDVQVAIHSAVTVRVEVLGSEPRPGRADSLRLQYRYQPAEFHAEMPLERDSDGRWVVVVPAHIVKTGLWYRVAGGDAVTPEYRVDVRATPLLTGYEIVYTYRPYLRWAAETRRDPNLEALRGTEVTLVAFANRNVQSGRLEIEGAAKPILSEIVPDNPKAMRFRFVLDREGTYRIWFQTEDGDHNVDPLPYTIRVLTDAVPRVKITSPEQETKLPANGVLRVAGRANDDFGLTGMALKLRLADGPVLLDKPYRPDLLPERPDLKPFQLVDGSFPTELDYLDHVDLDKLQHDGKPLQPGQVLEYWLEAADACDYPPPGPQVGRSDPVHRLILLEPEKDPKKREQDRRDARKEQRRHERRQDDDLKQENQKRQQPDNPDETPEQRQHRNREEQLKKALEDQQKSGKDEPGQEQKQGAGKDGAPKNPADGQPEKKPSESKEGGEKNPTNPDKQAGESKEGGKADSDNQNPEKKPAEGKQGGKDAQPKPGERNDPPSQSKQGGQNDPNSDNLDGKPSQGREGGKADPKEGDPEKKPSQGKQGGINQPQNSEQPEAAEKKPSEGKEGAKPDGKPEKQPSQGKHGAKNQGEEQAGQPEDQQATPGQGKQGGDSGRPTTEENKQPGNAKQGGGRETGQPEKSPSAGKPAGKSDQGQPDQQPAEGKSGSKPEKGRPETKPSEGKQAGRPKEGQPDKSPSQGKQGGNKSGQDGEKQPPENQPGQAGDEPSDDVPSNQDPSDAVENAIDRFETARDPKEKRAAREQLEKTARESKNPADRAAAQRALDKADRQPGGENPSGENGQPKEGGQPGQSKQPAAGKDGSATGKQGDQPGPGQGSSPAAGKNGQSNGDPSGNSSADNPGTAKHSGNGDSKGTQAGQGKSGGGAGQSSGDATSQKNPHGSGGNSGGSADEPGSPADLKNQLKAGELQLETFKQQVTKDMLQKLGWTEDDYKKFLDQAEKNLAELREKIEKNPEGASNVGNIGARRVASPNDSRSDPLQRGAVRPPAEYRDAYKEFTEKLSTIRDKNK